MEGTDLFDDLIQNESWDFSIHCDLKRLFHETYGTGDADYRLTYGHDCGMMNSVFICAGCLDQFKIITDKTCASCDKPVPFLASTIITIEDI